MSIFKNTTRNLKARVKTARGRTISSVNWLARQLNDPYVQHAKSEGYRSRAAYKLLEIDAKFKLLSKGKTVIDLYSTSYGGWTQVAVAKVKPAFGGKIISIDLAEMDDIKGATFIKKDFLADETEQEIISYLSYW